MFIQEKTLKYFVIFSFGNSKKSNTCKSVSKEKEYENKKEK